MILFFAGPGLHGQQRVHHPGGGGAAGDHGGDADGGRGRRRRDNIRGGGTGRGQVAHIQPEPCRIVLWRGRKRRFDASLIRK